MLSVSIYATIFNVGFFKFFVSIHSTRRFDVALIHDTCHICSHTLTNKLTIAIYSHHGHKKKIAMESVFITCRVMFCWCILYPLWDIFFTIFFFLVFLSYFVMFYFSLSFDTFFLFLFLRFFSLSLYLYLFFFSFTYPLCDSFLLYSLFLSLPRSLSLFQYFTLFVLAQAINVGNGDFFLLSFIFDLISCLYLKSLCFFSHWTATTTITTANENEQKKKRERTTHI